MCMGFKLNICEWISNGHYVFEFKVGIIFVSIKLKLYVFEF